MNLSTIILRAIEVSSANAEIKQANKALVKQLTSKLRNHLYELKPKAFQVRFEKRGGEYRWVLDTRFEYLSGSKYRGWIHRTQKTSKKSWVASRPMNRFKKHIV